MSKGTIEKPPPPANREKYPRGHVRQSLLVDEARREVQSEEKGSGSEKHPQNLAEKLTTFPDRFSPRTVTIYNNNNIVVTKIHGPFLWYKHDDTDDLFLVLKSTLG